LMVSSYLDSPLRPHHNYGERSEMELADIADLRERLWDTCTNRESSIRRRCERDVVKEVCKHPQVQELVGEDGEGRG
jgi:hypothetical protein